MSDLSPIKSFFPSWEDDGLPDKTDAQATYELCADAIRNVDVELLDRVRAELDRRGRPAAAWLLHDQRPDLSAGQCMAYVKALHEDRKAGAR